MSQLPDYVASATPNPAGNRAWWLTTTAATYAGIMLWFAFWANLPPGGGIEGGVLSQGLLFALVSLAIAAFICYACFYHVPGMLGMKTGLPLYIVGTSTYGVQGGYLMPGFLMGVLQFGWLSVNGLTAGAGFAILAAGRSMCPELGVEVPNPPNVFLLIGIGAVWAAIAAFIGLKGIKYVGMIATYMPIIPVVALLCLLAFTAGGAITFTPSDFHAEGATPATMFGLDGGLGSTIGQFAVLSLILTIVVGFFATAGAAGCDFGSNNKDRTAVIYGGLVGIVLATLFAGGIALIAVAGSYGGDGVTLNPYHSLREIMGAPIGGFFILMLAIAAFPSACFSSLIAANCFKAMLPKTNPFISCGIGTIVACILIAVMAIFDFNVSIVFKVVGASFGPVCGAMMADYFLSGKKWAGPRAGINLPGWISWFVGFLVGGLPVLGIGAAIIPCPPVSAFVVGFALYYILAKAGLESPKLDMPQRIDLETNS